MLPSRFEPDVPMETNPKLRAARVAQLAAGELFIFQSRSVRCVALVVEDDTQSEPQKLVLPIGPTLPQHMTCPTLVQDFGLTVTSFGAGYCLQWPIEPDAWTDDEPPVALTTIALADDGPFLRCNYSPVPNHYQACFVDLATGKICSEGKGASGRYIRPPGIYAFATSWALLTLETPPRTILRLPFDSVPSA